MKIIPCLTFFAGALPLSAAIYAIDIDSTRLGGSDTSGIIDTETGFTSLDATNGGNATVNIDGIDFSLFTVGANASRLRDLGAAGNPGSGNATSLTRDLVFEDGADAAVGIQFGVAGSLPAGEYQVEIWAWELNGNPIDPLIIAYRENTVENQVTDSFTSSATDPFTFNFISDGVSAYDVFVRENNSGNRTRLNAIRLTTVPEPSSALLSGLALVGLLRRRR